MHITRGLGGSKGIYYLLWIFIDVQITSHYLLYCFVNAREGLSLTIKSGGKYVYLSEDTPSPPLHL